ncbi:very long chain fatty acid elongase F-like [Drosophila kikkawai]|uniref:Elongation of very long chain fatty acids protein n=1 Tax=Drosophila kikkawai TaxID=30033 RepID=A0A6P4ISS0_DROKI|nr:elongation of very long chain fatty acids protein F-like [Drosophila kikkawai]
MIEILNMTSSGDPVQLPLMGSPWSTLIILSAYLLIALKPGRKFMENREPFDLRGVIKVYNLVQILYNSLMLACGLYFLIFLKAYDLSCVHRLPLDHEHKNWERVLAYAYYFNKYMDLAETIFFLLRKKFRQITFLHVFHHFNLALFGYFYMTFSGYGGVMFPVCLLNVAVHIIMYTYYYLSSVSTKVQASLWWKKYITIVQLVQFLLGFIYFSNTLRRPNCDVSQTVIYPGMLLQISFFVLFGNFYVRAYILPGRKQSRRKML